MLKAALILLILAVEPCLLFSQATPTERRVGDLQVGAAYSIVHIDYTVDNPGGFGAYADFDFRSHLGVEANFRTAGSDFKETTYSIGPRLILHRRGFTPYAKVLFGRGAFGINVKGEGLPGQAGSFNVLTYGIGLDYSLRKHINLRLIDFEYQKWLSFPPHDLQPTAVSFGVAYHF